MRVKSIDELPMYMRNEAQAKLAEFQGGAVPELQIVAAAAPQPPTPATKPRKYRNQPIVVNGERYDSKCEYHAHEWLRALYALGELRWILRQVSFRLEGGVVYRCDFMVELVTGPPFVDVWDAKGRDTQASINKRKQVKARYGIEVKLWPRDANLPRPAAEIAAMDER